MEGVSSFMEQLMRPDGNLFLLGQTSPVFIFLLVCNEVWDCKGTSDLT